MVGLFRDYMGTGMLVIWYLLSLAYLWIHERRGHVRVVFLYVPIVLLLAYFNPLLSLAIRGVTGSDIYWRMLWLLPMAMTIAYAGVCVYGQIEDRGKRREADLFALCLLCIFAVSGRLMYSSPRFLRAENLYHMPNSVVRLCDAIQVPGREVMAAFPLDLVPYVRQYSPVVCMPYGREVAAGQQNWYHPLAVEMEREVVDLETLVPLAREAGCHYCILPIQRELKGDPGDYGWLWFAETDDYVIYRDPAVELWNPQTGQFQ